MSSVQLFMMLVFNFQNVFLHTQKIHRNNHGKGYFIVKQLGNVDSNFSENSTSVDPLAASPGQSVGIC